MAVHVPVFADTKVIEKEMKAAVAEMEKKYSSLQLVPVTKQLGNPVVSGLLLSFLLSSLRLSLPLASVALSFLLSHFSTLCRSFFVYFFTCVCLYSFNHILSFFLSLCLSRCVLISLI